MNCALIPTPEMLEVKRTDAEVSDEDVVINCTITKLQWHIRCHICGNTASASKAMVTTCNARICPAPEVLIV